MTFRVNISALRGLPEFLDRRDHDLHAAVTYLTEFATIRDIAPLYRGMSVRHQANVSTIARFLADTAAYVSTDATRVRAAANAYALADVHAKIRNIRAADDALDDFPTGLADPQPPFAITVVTAAAFADRSDLVRRLTAPIDQPTSLPEQPSWTRSVSVAGVVREAIWAATRLAALFGLIDRAYDPIDLFLTPFVGDWPGLLRSAQALRAVADLLGDETAAIDGAHRTVPTVWAGHASDACQCNLGNLVLALRAAGAQIGALADAYAAAGSMLRSITVAAGDAFDLVVDAASDVVVDQLSVGSLLPYTVPGTVMTFVHAVNAFGGLAQRVGQVVTSTFPPGDPLGPLAHQDTPLVLTDMHGLAGQADIPVLMPVPTSLAATPARPGRMAA